MRIPSWLSSLARLSDSLSGPPYLADSATSNRRAAEVKHGRLSQSNHLKTGRYSRHRLQHKTGS